MRRSGLCGYVALVWMIAAGAWPGTTPAQTAILCSLSPFLSSSFVGKEVGEDRGEGLRVSRQELVNRWVESAKRIACHCYKYQAWSYDPEFGPTDAFSSYSKGTIAIGNNRWMCRAEQLMQYKPPRGPGDRPCYTTATELPPRLVYDGHAVFWFDCKLRRCTQYVLPARYRKTKVSMTVPPGTSWLRLLGRVETKQLSESYSLRLLNSGRSSSGMYWLEARRKDAPRWPGIDSTTCRVGLDARSYTPRAIIILHAATANSKRTSLCLEQFTPEHPNELFSTASPAGWASEKVVVPDNVSGSQAMLRNCAVYVTTACTVEYLLGQWLLGL